MDDIKEIVKKTFPNARIHLSKKERKDDKSNATITHYIYTRNNTK